MQFIMPLRKEWKSSPIRVDPQAVVGVKVRRVFKTELVIILQRAVWIHIVSRWSCFNLQDKKRCMMNISFCLVYNMFSTAHQNMVDWTGLADRGADCVLSGHEGVVNLYSLGA